MHESRSTYRSFFEVIVAHLASLPSKNERKNKTKAQWRARHYMEIWWLTRYHFILVSTTSTARAATKTASIVVTTTSASSSTNASSTISSSADSTTTPSSKADNAVGQQSPHTGLIASLVVAGIVIVILILLVAFLLRRRKRRQPFSTSSRFHHADEKRGSIQTSNPNRNNENNNNNENNSSRSNKRSSKGGILGRLSVLSFQKTPGTPETSIMSPPPMYTADEENVHVLNSTLIHELPISTPVHSMPAELAISTPRLAQRGSDAAFAAAAAAAATATPATVFGTGDRYNPDRGHIMSWAEHGAEQDEVGELGGTLLFGQRKRPSGPNRESWMTAGSARMSINETPAVVNEEEDALGIQRC